jgi:uncharacterized protein YbjQ (UPF0145 family)
MAGLKKQCALLLCFSILYSCIASGGSFVNSNYTPITSDEYYNNSESVDVYFEGTEVNRDYIQIGFVESTGRKNTGNDLMIAHLQYRAYQKGADAVINVKKMFKNKVVSSSSENTKIEGKSLPVFMGTAIKYMNELPDDLKRQQTNKKFLKVVEQDIQKTDNSKTISTITAISLFVAFVVVLNNLIKQGEADQKALQKKN